MSSDDRRREIGKVPTVAADRFVIKMLGGSEERLSGAFEKHPVGGSFTIFNHGMSGSLLATPIILHAGQAAILGVGELEKRVVVCTLDGQDAILIRSMAYGR